MMEYQKLDLFFAKIHYNFTLIELFFQYLWNWFVTFEISHMQEL